MLSSIMSDVDFHTRGATFAVCGPNTAKTLLAKSLIAEFKKTIVLTPNVKDFESLDCSVVDCSLNDVDLEAVLFDEEVLTFVIVDHYYPEYMTAWLTPIINESNINATFMLLTHNLSDLPNFVKLVNTLELGEEQSLASPQTIEVEVVTLQCGGFGYDAYMASVGAFFGRPKCKHVKPVKPVEQSSMAVLSTDCNFPNLLGRACKHGSPNM